MKREYDLIIVGSGLYGATVAYIAKQKGKRCLVLERRKDVGGNIRDEWMDGINVHLYGAHIFHTDEKIVWDFAKKFASFIPYIHTVIAKNEGKLYHLPFNMNTFYDVFGTILPSDVQRVLESEHEREYYSFPRNLEEKAINLIGRTLYELLVKGYTEKQWGVRATDLSPDLISRLPVRWTYDNRYFSDTYQGVPQDGYAKMILKMLDGVEVRTNVDFCSSREHWMSMACEVVYTGMVDELMEYKLGELEYRSLRFETETIDIANYQGMAVINETNVKVGYTRTIEHKHFDCCNCTSHTVITREYPQKWKAGLEPFYPINNKRNEELYRKYRDWIDCVYPNMIIGGRLGDFKYYDMDDTILQAMKYALK